MVIHSYLASASDSGRHRRLYDPKKELKRYRARCAKPASDCENVTDLPTCLSCHDGDGITLNVSHADDTPHRRDPEQLLRDIQTLREHTITIRDFVGHKKTELVQSVRMLCKL